MSASRFHVAQGDAVAFLRSLPAGSVDMLCTDPAYESLEKHRAVGTTTRLKHSDASSNDWFEIFRNERFPEFFAEAFRVLKRDAHLYFLCDQETLFIAKPVAEAAGFKFWKPLVWDKQTIGMGYHYRARYEFVLFFEKGKRRLNDLGVPDVLSFKRVRGAVCDCERTEPCRTSTPRDTSKSTLAMVGTESPMSSNGSGITDPCLPGTRSTIATRTRRTTASRTSSASTPPPTNESIQGASFETACGGNPATDAPPSSPLLLSTGTSTPTGDGLSLGDVDPATSGSSSNASAPSACPKCGGPRRSAYATEKPVELLEVLVKQSTAPGELVVDPFCGSGSALVAAVKNGRSALGNDLAATAVTMATSRLGDALEVPLADLLPAGGQAALHLGAP